MLITLGIIGIVAALTMPTIMQNVRKVIVVNKLKTNVATFQNALRMAESKHGELHEWLTCGTQQEGEENFQGNCTKRVFEEYFAPEFKVLKVCDNTNMNVCWTAPKALNGDSLNGNTNNNPKAIGFVLANGTSCYMWVGNVTTTEPHIQIYFDIDGKDRGVNRVGADVFGVIAKSSERRGFTLWDNDADPKSLCSKTSTDAKNGQGCGVLIYQNGWEIPKDYPISF
ncbi:type II secretion system protein [bacterium]|nr:type II secretion system protein [bacterium]